MRQKPARLPPVIRTRITQFSTASVDASWAEVSGHEGAPKIQAIAVQKRKILEKAFLKEFQDKQDEIDRLRQEIQQIHMSHLGIST